MILCMNKLTYMFKGKIKTVISLMPSSGPLTSLDSSSVTPVLSGPVQLLPVPQMSLRLCHLPHESSLQLPLEHSSLFFSFVQFCYSFDSHLKKYKYKINMLITPQRKVFT